MKRIDWKKVFPHLIAIAIFLIVAVIYCKPVLEGRQLQQSDVTHWKGMAQNSFEYKEKHGHFPLWTNGMFSGMPAYQIALEQTHPVSILYFQTILTLGLPKPIHFFFLACICFYILSMVMRINPWAAIMASLAFAYSTYDPVIIAVGHDTKMTAIAYMPGVIAALILLYRKQYWLGSMLLAVMLSLQVSTSHVQIVYYTMWTGIALTIRFLIGAIKDKDYKHIFISLSIAAVIAVVSLGVNAVSTFTTYEYSKYSMRGGESELSSGSKTTTQGGLDKDYAFRWSYGIGETMTLFSPGIYGGSNGGREYSKSEFAAKLQEVGYPEETALQYANGSSYWGPQTLGTSGPVYVGAVICVLFICAFFFTKSWHRWWLLAASLFAIMLAWGKNFSAFNYFIFDYLPLYKKFRAPTMSLVMVQFCFPLLGAICLTELVRGEMVLAERLKQFKKAAIAVGAVVLVLILLYFSADFAGPNDDRLADNFTQGYLQQTGQSGQPAASVQQQATEFGKSFVTALRADRKSLFTKDMFTSLVLFGLTLGLIFLYIKKSVSTNFLLLALLVVSSWDLLSTGRKYLYDEMFVDNVSYEQTFTMTQADAQIKQDKGYFRVFNQTVDPFNDAMTSYYHNTIGGYHPAKLQIYQDLIEHQLGKGNMQVFNMLNTKYFIQQNPQDGKPVAALNSGAFGPAWFVKAVKPVADANASMSALDNTNLRDTAVVLSADAGKISIGADSAARIELIKNDNDLIEYKTIANSPQFAVLSEIYYPAGWKAYVDEKETPIIKTNYALRGVAVPAGNHQLTLRFDPQSFKNGDRVVLWTSILVQLLIVVGIYFLWKRSKRNEA
jgi:hypothetical protein